MPQAPDEYFVTQERLAQYREAHARGALVLDHDPVVAPVEEDVAHLPDTSNYGTIGAVAQDRFGNLAAATSTGGIVNKREGRIGDSSIVGAGVYADTATCAVSATGYGEDFIRTVLAKSVSDIIDYLGYDAFHAAKAGIAYLVRRVKGRGGIIVIDKDGNCASRFTTKRIIHGWIENGGKTACTF
jgi:beta-aspartyl-peptidase (threonine type)